MASLPPIVKWFKGDESGETALWDAGIVEAGSESTPQEFHVWNNRGNSTAVADMINTTISVRDKDGGTTDKTVCGQLQAIASVQFWDQSKNGGSGQWGYYDPTTNLWVANNYIDLKYDAPRKVQAVGLASTPMPVQQISGAINTADVVADGNNYSKMNLKLLAKSDAGAGEIWWITRISYQYT